MAEPRGSHHAERLPRFTSRGCLQEGVRSYGKRLGAWSGLHDGVDGGSSSGEFAVLANEHAARIVVSAPSARNSAPIRCARCLKPSRLRAPSAVTPVSFSHRCHSYRNSRHSVIAQLSLPRTRSPWYPWSSRAGRPIGDCARAQSARLGLSRERSEPCDFAFGELHDDVGGFDRPAAMRAFAQGERVERELLAQHFPRGVLRILYR